MSNTVLVVDDDPVSVSLLELVLKRSGYQVILARSASSGLQIAAEVKPDVILIDDMMPTMTGGEMCQLLKSNPELAHIPVIMISAGTRVQDASYVDSIGADYALTKPVLPKDVLQIVERALSRAI
ncbi:MAG: response regulator [Anaerolineae bacterium]|nr:response regulator [Anaerolineae bacterium]